VRKILGAAICLLLAWAILFIVPRTTEKEMVPLAPTVESIKRTTTVSTEAPTPKPQSESEINIADPVRNPENDDHGFHIQRYSNEKGFYIEISDGCSYWIFRNGNLNDTSEWLRGVFQYLFRRPQAYDRTQNFPDLYGITKSQFEYLATDDEVTQLLGKELIVKLQADTGVRSYDLSDEGNVPKNPAKHPLVESISAKLNLSVQQPEVDCSGVY